LASTWTSIRLQKAMSIKIRRGLAEAHQLFKFTFATTNSNFTTADCRSGMVIAPVIQASSSGSPSSVTVRPAGYRTSYLAFIGPAAHSDISINRVCEIGLIESGKPRLNAAFEVYLGRPNPSHPPWQVGQAFFLWPKGNKSSAIALRHLSGMAFPTKSLAVPLIALILIPAAVGPALHG
jgi:hypothetical protein